MWSAPHRRWQVSAPPPHHRGEVSEPAAAVVGRGGWFLGMFLPWLGAEVIGAGLPSGIPWVRLGLGLGLYAFSFLAGKSSGRAAAAAEGEAVADALRRRLEDKEEQRKEAWRVASTLERVAVGRRGSRAAAGAGGGAGGGAHKRV